MPRDLVDIFDDENYNRAQWRDCDDDESMPATDIDDIDIDGLEELDVQNLDDDSEVD